MGLLACTLLARADEAADQLARAGIAEFRAAHQSWDAARFGKSEEYFHKAAEKSPGAALNHYWQGVSAFHRMLQYRSQPASKAHEKAADAAMESAAAAFGRALEKDSSHAESHALLGTIYGMKIKGGMLRAIRYGPAVQEHREKALNTGAENPRVRYLLGAGLLHTAKDNHDRKAALKALLEAETFFAAEAKRPAKPFEPRWGRSSCLTFIGKTYEQLGEPAKAADYFRKALAEHPADHIAKDGLARVTAGN